MKVIGSGFGRTGTLSLKHALEELGFGPCYHMEEVLKNPAHVAVWHDASFGRPVDWPALFAPYGSAVDFPASVVYRDLLTVFPDAKVVHTVRDPDRWYESTLETIYQATTIAPEWMRRSVPAVRRWTEMVDRLVWDGIFEGRFEDRAFAIERYDAWTAEVVATVPAERLLVFEVSDGWGPLCDFLGVLQPDRGFPRVNDRDVMQRRFRVARTVTRAVPVVGVGLAAGIYGVSRRIRRS